jgi:ribosomal protein S27AE
MAQQNYPCQRCGTPMTYSPQNNQWYCSKCQAYIPAAPVRNTADHFERELTDAFHTLTGPTTTCPYCNGTATLNSQYNRWFCQRCNRWL